MRKGVLRNFAKFTRKNLCQSLFFNKVTSLRPTTLLKKRLWYRCFPVNFANFLRTPFLQIISGRLLLPVILETFYEIVLAFLSVESKTNINFTGNLLLGFGRHCGKALPEPAVFHLFLSACTHK